MPELTIEEKCEITGLSLEEYRQIALLASKTSKNEESKSDSVQEKKEDDVLLFDQITIKKLLSNKSEAEKARVESEKPANEPQINSVD